MKATDKVSRGQHAIINADFLHNNITADVTKKPCLVEKIVQSHGKVKPMKMIIIGWKGE